MKSLKMKSLKKSKASKGKIYGQNNIYSGGKWVSENSHLQKEIGILPKWSNVIFFNKKLTTELEKSNDHFHFKKLAESWQNREHSRSLSCLIPLLLS